MAGDENDRLCWRIKTAMYRADPENRERINAQQRARYAANRERIRERDNAARRARRANKSPAKVWAQLSALTRLEKRIAERKAKLIATLTDEARQTAA